MRTRARRRGERGTGIPVYNVALPVLREHYPDQPPFRIIEVPREAEAEASSGPRPHGRRSSDREPPMARVGDPGVADSAG
jgi:hypothetical protein